MNAQDILSLYQTLWTNQEDKQLFLTDPKSYLTSKGYPVKDGIEIVAHEDTQELAHFIIPDATASTDATQEDNFFLKLAKSQELREELKKDPKKVLQENGLAYPAATKVEVLENTSTVNHIVLPVNPASQELSEAQLSAVAGGKLNWGNFLDLTAGVTAGVCAAGAIFAGAGLVASAGIAGGIKLAKEIATLD